ncbi:MAG: DUF2953 domain-containing protein [Ruminococcaceae bacterium]|nr:DUF2953 domain-containing protein [Oscillospiraceae bacterium]
MSGIVVLLLFLFAFLFCNLLLSKLYIKIYLFTDTKDFDGHIDFEFYNLRLFRLKLGRRGNKKYSIFENREKFYKCLEKYNVSKLEIKGEIGLDDAATTAVSTGIAYTVFSAVYVLIANYINVEKVIFDIVPNFSKTRISFEFLCIIDVKVVNIIIDVIHVWVDYARSQLRNSEGESLLWQNIR